jgi:energy-converting hydrogenase Eha subunit A
MSSSRPSRITALLLGSLAVLALPVGGALTVFVASVKLLPAVVGSVAVAFFLGLCGLSASRRARFKFERSVARKGERTVRIARFLVRTGLYFSLIGAIAIAVYFVLRADG